MALKQFNPTSPGQRGLVLIDRSELHKGKPEKKLVEGLTKSGGRGGNGRVAVRFRGGGGVHHKVGIRHVNNHLIAILVEHALDGQAVKVLSLVVGNLLTVH